MSRIWLGLDSALAKLVVRFFITGEVTAAGVGSTSIASTGTKLTWCWVFSDLSSTTGMVLCQLCAVKAMYVDPAAVKGNPHALPTMSPAPARSCPKTMLSVSLLGRETGGRTCVILCL